jgi:hypothetical protein
MKPGTVSTVSFVAGAPSRENIYPIQVDQSPTQGVRIFAHPQSKTVETVPGFIEP